MTDPTDPTDQPAYPTAPPQAPVDQQPAAASAPSELAGSPQSQPEPQPTRPAPGFDDRGRVRPSKVSGVWVGLIGTALFLILLVIFIAQNSRRVSLHFFGWHGQFSLALTILLSAVIGVLLVAIPGTVRIFQLRSSLRKNGPGKAG
jgi:uncharacterized integral membrane protein